MAIFIKCTCGKTLEVLDELAGSNYKCIFCGAINKVLLPNKQAQKEPEAKQLKKCSLCRHDIPFSERMCPICGWDNYKMRRVCLTCESPIALSAGTALNMPILNTIVIILMLISGFIFGFIGSLSVGLMVIALVNLYSAMTIDYHCRGCGRIIPLVSIYEREEEKRDRQLRRIWLFIVSGSSGLASIVCAIVWLILFLSAHGIDLNAPPDIKLLEKKGIMALPELIQALKHDKVKTEADQIIRKMGKDAIPSLITALKDKDIRHQVVMILGALGPDAKEALPQILTAYKEEKEWDSPYLDAFSKIGKASAAPLIEALKDDNIAVRQKALKALKEMKEDAEEAVPAITRYLKNNDEDIILSALDVLRSIGLKSVDAIDTIIELLKDNRVKIRILSAQVISKIGRAALPSVPALIETLNDKEAEVRRVSAEALGNIGPPAREAIPALNKALEDEDEMVRWEANRALKLMGQR